MFEKSSTFQIPKEFLVSEAVTPTQTPVNFQASQPVASAPSFDFQVFLELNAIAEEIEQCRAAAR